jgi:hypothetical protein
MDEVSTYELDVYTRYAQCSTSSSPSARTSHRSQYFCFSFLGLSAYLTENTVSLRYEDE